MKEDKIDYLKELTEGDVRVICNNADLDLLLIPIQKNKNKKYSKDVSKLGRLDKKSQAVQKYLPKMAFDYYIKNDMEFHNIINQITIHLKGLFIEKLNKFKGNYGNNTDIKVFTIKEYKEFIIYTLLEDKETSINLDLLLLELKLNDIEISDTLKQELEEQWISIEEIVKVKKECKREYESDIRAIGCKFRDELKNKESDYKREIRSSKNEIKRLNIKIDDKEKELSDMKYQIKDLNKTINDKCKYIESKENEIEDLLLQIDIMKNEIEDLHEKLNKSKSELYNIVQSEWAKNNEQKLQELESLTKDIQLSYEKLELLNEEKINIEEQITTWNSYVEGYVDNLDLKILDYKINSLLFEKIGEKSKYTNSVEERVVYDDNLYIREGYTPQKVILCNDYDDYLDVVENNLSYSGIGRKSKFIYECFNASINSNLIPLICGYASRKIATVLIASRFGEIPTVISIPGGYNNTLYLEKSIEELSTNTVIIEDAFGKMSEGVILPLLRKSHNKQIIFTAESMEDLEYLPKHYYNYLYLIGIKEYSLPEGDEIIYACGEDIFKNQLFDRKSKGNKIARKILDNMNLGTPYIISRGQVLNNLLLENMDEREVVEYLFNSELKWIISEEYMDELENTFNGEVQMI